MKKNRALIFLGMVVWLVLFVPAAFYFPGSVYSYAIFSIAFLLLLINGFYSSSGYGYTFFVLILWLGFWLKFTLHLLINYPFGEPIGSFLSTPESWDSVLNISTVGALGVLAANYFFQSILGQSTPVSFTERLQPPLWYKKRRYFYISFIVAAIILIVGLNFAYSFQQSGLVPKTVIWPLNAIIYWMLSIGLALTVATIVGWEVSLNRQKFQVFYLILLEASLSSVAILSRGLYFFHTIPALFVIFKNFNKFKSVSLKQIYSFILLSITLLFTVYFIVNSMRAIEYSGREVSLIDNKMEILEGALNIDMVVVDRLLRFTADRWIGLEGVMSVSSYPERGWGLFFDALSEKGEIGKTTLYQRICNSHYAHMDTKKFQFASLPGPVAFFYFSNSFILVFVGMFALGIFLIFSEKIVFLLMQNPLVSSLWGITFASSFAQMGVAPRGLFLFFVLTAIGILFLYVVQNFSLIVNKLNMAKKGYGKNSDQQ